MYILTYLLRLGSLQSARFGTLRAWWVMDVWRLSEYVIAGPLSYLFSTFYLFISFSFFSDATVSCQREVLNLFKVNFRWGLIRGWDRNWQFHPVLLKQSGWRKRKTHDCHTLCHTEAHFSFLYFCLFSTYQEWLTVMTLIHTCKQMKKRKTHINKYVHVNKQIIRVLNYNRRTLLHGRQLKMP